MRRSLAAAAMSFAPMALDSMAVDAAAAAAAVPPSPRSAGTATQGSDAAYMAVHSQAPPSVQADQKMMVLQA